MKKKVLTNEEEDMLIAQELENSKRVAKGEVGSENETEDDMDPQDVAIDEAFAINDEIAQELEDVTQEDLVYSEEISGFLSDVFLQEQQIQQIDPEFDLVVAMEEEPLFAMMLAKGRNLEEIYGFFNPDYIRSKVEKEVVGRIKKRNLRPDSIKGQSGASTSVRDFSEEDIRDIDSKVRRGVRVKFN